MVVINLRIALNKESERRWLFGSWIAILVMMLLMLISYLDRGNVSLRSHDAAETLTSQIGFAATQGMADDIGLVGSQLNVSRT